VISGALLVVIPVTLYVDVIIVCIVYLSMGYFSGLTDFLLQILKTSL